MSSAHEVAGRVIDAINAHDIDALRGLYATDVRTRRPGWPREGGIEELLASYEMDFACVPDIRFARLATFSDDPYVATEIRITGTNTGPTVLGDIGKALLGNDVEEVPATGRPIDLRSAQARPVDGSRVLLRSAAHVRPFLLRDSSCRRACQIDCWLITRRLLGLVYTASKSCDVLDCRTSVRRTPLELSKLRCPAQTREYPTTGQAVAASGVQLDA